MKGRRYLTTTVEVTVALDDVEYNTTDEWSKLYHDSKFRQAQHSRVGTDISRALRVLSLGYEDITINVQKSSMDLHTNEEDEAAHTAMLEAKELEYERLFAAVDAVEKEIGIKQCVWSFSTRGQYDDIDYRQTLIDNLLFRNGKVRFTYSGGWDDPELLVDDLVINNPHMRDVFMAADRLLVRSKDNHHVFVEAAIYQGVDSDGVHVYDFSYGS